MRWLKSPRYIKYEVRTNDDLMSQILILKHWVSYYAPASCSNHGPYSVLDFDASIPTWDMSREYVYWKFGEPFVFFFLIFFSMINIILLRKKVGVDAVSPLRWGEIFQGKHVITCLSLARIKKRVFVYFFSFKPQEFIQRAGSLYVHKMCACYW